MEGLCLFVTEPTQSSLDVLVTHNNRTNRMLRRRSTIQISNLSVPDGMVLAYRGCGGRRRIWVQFRRGSLINGQQANAELLGRDDGTGLNHDAWVVVFVVVVVVDLHMSNEQAFLTALISTCPRSTHF